MIKALGKARKECKALSYGSYKELMLTTTQYAFERSIEGETAIITVNNSDGNVTMNFNSSGNGSYIGVLSGTKMKVENGRVSVEVKENSGEIWLPLNDGTGEYEPVEFEVPVEKQAAVLEEGKEENKENKGSKQESKLPEKVRAGISYEEMTIEELQLCIIEKMAKNGPVTDQMRKTVIENTHHGSLCNWVRSFN